jgi:hypothetical protein
MAYGNLRTRCIVFERLTSQTISKTAAESYISGQIRQLIPALLSPKIMAEYSDAKQLATYFANIVNKPIVPDRTLLHNTGVASDIIAGSGYFGPTSPEGANANSLYEAVWRIVSNQKKTAQEGMFEGIRREQLEQPEEEPLEPWDDPTATPLDEGNEPPMSQARAFEEIKKNFGHHAPHVLRSFVENFGDLDWYDPADVAYFIHYFWFEYD